MVCNSCLRELCPLPEISFVLMAQGHAIAEDAAAVFFSLQGDFVLNLGSENYKPPVVLNSLFEPSQALSLTCP